MRFFEVAELGPPPRYEMHHRKLPYDGYHHWAVIGEEDTLSGTASLKGDVVVFPGATLTVKSGTTITFPSNRDRHQFAEGDSSLSEILVYGTLKAAGTASDSVFFRRSGSQGTWGGIRKMPGGTVDLPHTAILHTLPGRPTRLEATRGDSQVVLDWTPSNHVGNTGWKYLSGTLSGTDTTWGAWQSDHTG